MSLPTPLTPARLEKGDLIAVVAPSERINHEHPQRVTRAKTIIESHGYRMKDFFTPTLSSSYAESLSQRSAELTSAFADREVKAIICAHGGITANQLLSHIDYATIRANPKIFVGYSDITLLHHAIYVKTGLRTFYGPDVISVLGEYPTALEFSVENMFRVLEDPDPRGQLPRSSEWTQEYYEYEDEVAETRARKLVPNEKGWTWLRPGKAQGRLFGGCLPSVCQLTGTPFLREGMYEGRILVLETPESDDVSGNPFPLVMAECAMTDLRNAGILTAVKGLVLGRPAFYDEKMTKEFEDMVTNVCYGMDVPILAGVDVGHTSPILTLPMDGLVGLDSERGVFEILEGCVQ